MKKTILIAALMAAAVTLQAKTFKDISYTAKTDAYSKERLKLDIYAPDDAKDCPVVVWFHGGGLTGGEKSIPRRLKDKGLIIASVNYRLLPNVTIDAPIDDAAEAVAWVFKNIQQYGGDTKKIYVSGHSAGGYLTMMIGFDKSWLGRYGIDADRIKALIPFSGQAISHFAYRDMNGIDALQPLIDKYAPLYHVRPDTPPIVLITGDREKELYGRYEENAYLWRMFKLAGHKSVQLLELDGFAHSPMAEPAFLILLDYIKNDK